MSSDSPKFSSISDMLDALGGDAYIASLYNIHQLAVERWRKRGIPWWHWPLLQTKFSISAQHLLDLNLLARFKNRD